MKKNNLKNKKSAGYNNSMENYPAGIEFKGAATSIANESGMQALVKLCNLPHTRSKSKEK